MQKQTEFGLHAIPGGGPPSARRLAGWQWAWLLAAAISLPAVAYHAYKALQENARLTRVQLIERYSLWETDPRYRGTPKTWTRFAAMLLTSRQLMQRVREKHGAVADQIEQDLEFDTTLAQSRIIAGYIGAWGAPLALLYGAGWLFERRKRRRS